MSFCPPSNSATVMVSCERVAIFPTPGTFAGASEVLGALTEQSEIDLLGIWGMERWKWAQFVACYGTSLEKRIYVGL